MLSAGLIHEKSSILVAVNLPATDGFFFSFLFQIIECMILGKSDKSTMTAISSFGKLVQTLLVTRLL